MLYLCAYVIVAEFGPKPEICLNNAASPESNPLTAESGTESPPSDKEIHKHTTISYLPGLSWVRFNSMVSSALLIPVLYLPAQGSTYCDKNHLADTIAI